MNIEKIEQIIKLVKENDVKKFKYKNFEDEIEIDFTDSNQKRMITPMFRQMIIMTLNHQW